MLDKRKFYINGEWVAPLAANDLEVINPTTEKPVAVISMGAAADIDRAVAAAKKAFVTYSRTGVEERLALLEKLLEIYKRRYEEMAQTITLELGAPITMSREQQADVGVGHLQGFIDALKRLKMRDVLPNGDVMLREPIGVCGLITPWNWPINQIALKVVPALATGSTCVLKPSEFTPLNAMLYAEMVDEAGFPAGTVSGAPKIRAMEIIDELEPQARGPYAGAVGYLSYSGDVDTCIAIRTLVVEADKTSVTAGAGIVADSDPHSEEKETENKAAALLQAVALAQELEDFS